MGTQYSHRISLALIIFWAVTLLIPLVLVPKSTDSAPFAVLWTYEPPDGMEPDGFITGPLHLFHSGAILIFNLLFAVQVTRYCRGPASLKGTVALGVASLLFPAILCLLIAWPAVVSGTQQYFGPLPHQFIWGILLVRSTNRRRETSTWNESKEKEPWWKKDRRTSSE